MTAAQSRLLQKSIDATIYLHNIIAGQVSPEVLLRVNAIMRQSFQIGQLVGAYETRSLTDLLNSFDEDEKHE